MLLFISFSSYGQIQFKSDQIKYHLILDNSGSVSLLDTKRNLQSMISRFSYLDGLFDTTKSSQPPKLSMDFWVYGETVNEFEGDGNNSPYSISIDDDSYENAYRALQGVLKSEIERTRKVMFSELHKALERVLTTVKEKESRIKQDPNLKKKSPSHGVIIFTDGVLRGADFSQNESRKDYNKRIIKLVTELEAIHKVPVFFVVTSPKPKVIEYIDFLHYELDSLKEDQTYYAGNRLFWVKASTSFKEESNSSDLIKSFDDFHQRVNREIMTQGEADLQAGDKIQMAMLVQELLIYDSAYTKGVDIDSVMEVLKGRVELDTVNAASLIQNEVERLINQLAKSHGVNKARESQEVLDLREKMKEQVDSARTYLYFFRLNRLIGNLGDTSKVINYLEIAQDLDYISEQPEVLYELVNQVKKRRAVENLKTTFGIDNGKRKAPKERKESPDIPKEEPNNPEERPDGGAEPNSLVSTALPKSYAEQSISKRVYANIGNDTLKLDYEDAKSLSLRFIDAIEAIDEFDIGTEVSETSRNLESDIITGFSDYLIERVKMETIVAFFEVLQEDLELFEIDQLFPNSWSLLKTPDNYTDYATIHLAFKSDLEALPKTLVKLKKTLKQNSTFIGAYYTYFLIKGLIDHGDFKKALIDLKDHQVFGKVDYALLDETQKASYLAEQHILFIAELIQIPEKHDLTKLLAGEDKKGLESLAKLITSLALVDNKTAKQLATDLEAKGHKVLNAVSEFYQNYHFIRNDIKRLKDLAGKEPESDFEQYRKYRFSLLLNILERSADLLIDTEEMFSEIVKEKGKQRDIQSIVQNLKLAKDFYFEIKKKNYEKAVFLVLPHLTALTKGNVDLEALTRFGQDINDIIDNRRELKDYLKKERITLLFDKTAFETYLKEIENFGPDATSASKSLKDKAKEDLKNKFGKLAVKLEYLEAEKKYRVVRTDIDKLRAFFETITELNYSELSSRKLKRKNWLENAKIQKMLKDSVRVHFNTDKVSKFLSVAGKVANASSSDDVKNILSRTAMPVASYKLKRHTPGTIMVNAYVGAGFTHYDDDQGIKPSIFAPVGLEYSIKMLKRNKSFSIMAALFDVGNVIDYRVRDNDEDAESFNFQDILSPGMILSWGFSDKVPLSVNAGYMFNPERYVVSLNFDLPLFKIWSSR